MAIPKIDEQNIMAAIKYIDEHEIPDKDKSTQYVLGTEEGKQYPPSVIVEDKENIIQCYLYWQIALQLNVTLFKYANEILAYRGKYS